MKSPGYIELHAHSNHSLLDGVPFPEDLVARAAAYEMPALALTDHDGLYGAVRFIRAAEAVGIKPILGAELTLTDASHLTLLTETAEGYANLSHLITLAHLNRPKGVARLDPGLLADHHRGLIALSGCRHGAVSRALLAGEPRLALDTALQMARIFGPHHYYIELQRHYHPGDAHLVRDLHKLALQLGLGVVATGNVHYLEPVQREIHDILTCIRLNTSLDQTGDHLRPNDEYRFHSPETMSSVSPISRKHLPTRWTLPRGVSAATFLVDGHQILPIFETPNGDNAPVYLRRLCEQALQAAILGVRPAICWTRNCGSSTSSSSATTS